MRGAPFLLEFNLTSSRNEPEEKHYKDRAHYRNQDGINQPSYRRYAESASDVSADNGPDDSKNGVGDKAVTRTSHDRACSPASYHAHNDPPKQTHLYLLKLPPVGIAESLSPWVIVIVLVLRNPVQPGFCNEM